MNQYAPAHFSQGPASSRRHKRVLMRSIFPLDSDISFRRPTWGKGQQGVLHSLSTGGAFIKGGMLPEMGTEIVIQFNFCQREIQCTGRVIYLHRSEDGLTPRGFGVKFTRMLADDFKMVSETIERFYSGGSVDAN